MSSCGNPTTETDAIMPRRRKFDKTKNCIKCKTNMGNIVVRHAVYCKECFFPLVTTKFKRSLDPSVNAVPDGPRRTKLKASGNLLLAFSGGLGSTVLLDLVSQCYFSSRLPADDGKPQGGKDHPRNINARVWKKAAVCYVEVCNAFPGMRDRTNEVRAIVDRYQAFDFIPLRIEDAFDEGWWMRVGGKPDDLNLGVDLTNEDLLLSSVSDQHAPVQSLHAYLSCLPTQTAIPTTVQTLTRLLLLYTAHSTHSSHLLFGTSLTSLSISLISSIAQGGGFVVREEAQEEWMPSGDSFQGGSSENNARVSVRVNRPLRDVGMKECAAWAWWTGLKVVGKEKFPGARQGIGGLTKDFIVGLEKDYPSTVSTIARTCGKLAARDASGGTCVLCQRPVQRDVQAWKTRTSMRSFPAPDSLSTRPPTVLDPPAVQESLTPHLCYACHTTLTSRSSRGSTASALRDLPLSTPTPAVKLPVWMQSRLHGMREAAEEGNGWDGRAAENTEVWEEKKMDKTEMKDAIADFLLDE